MPSTTELFPNATIYKRDKKELGILIYPALIMAICLWDLFSNPLKGETIVVALISGIGSLLYYYYFASYQLIITDLYLIQKSLSDRTIIGLNQIESYNVQTVGKGRMLVLHKKNETTPSFTINYRLENHEAFMEWLIKLVPPHKALAEEMETLRKEYEEELTDLLGNQDYGYDIAERSNRLEWAQYVSTGSWLGGSVMALCAFGSLYLGVNSWLAVLVTYAFLLFPYLLAYFLWSFKGVLKIGFYKKETTSYPTIKESFIMIWMPIFFWSVSYYYMIEYYNLCLYTLLYTLLPTVLLLKCSNELTYRKIKDYAYALGLYLLLCINTVGSLLFFNTYYDTSSIEIFETTIQAKLFHGDKDSDHVRKVLLAPWEKCKAPYEVEVRQDTYRRMQQGQQLELHVRKGYLGIEWYTIQFAAPQE